LMLRHHREEPSLRRAITATSHHCDEPSLRRAITAEHAFVSLAYPCCRVGTEVEGLVNICTSVQASVLLTFCIVLAKNLTVSCARALESGLCSIDIVATSRFQKG
jgi:hypothetical protein